MDNTISSINLKIVSLNVRGLNDFIIKRRKVFKWLHKQTAHCFFSKKPLAPKKR